MRNPDFIDLEPRTRLSRREFVVTTLGTGFAAAVQPVAAQTRIATDTQGLEVSEVTVPVKDGAMPAYVARPAGKKNLPVVLVVQEIFGVHEHIKDVARRFAKAGYLAVAPELYARQGDVSKLANIDDIRPIVAKVPDAQVMSDMDAAADWAGKNGGDAKKLAITGFCWGGRIVWLYAAHNPNLKAGVAWYGRVEGQGTDLQPKNPVHQVRLADGKIEGLIPTGWYPNALSLSSDSKRLAVSTLLGPGSGWRGPGRSCADAATSPRCTTRRRAS